MPIFKKGRGLGKELGLKMKILAVDDDNAVRISLNVMFRKWTDIQLEVAEDARNALEKWLLMST